MEKEEVANKQEPVAQTSVEPLKKKNIFLANDAINSEEPKPAAPAKRPMSKFFGRVSKFKHLKGDVILKGRFDNLKNLSRTVPAECDYFHANADRVAVPITGPGGKIAVFEAKRPGRIPDGVTPVLINACNVMDFAFDPFNTSRLVAACDDGRVRVWQIPEGGLVQQINDPEADFLAHSDKIQLVKFHPLAKDVLLTAAFDRTVKIWDLSNTDVPRIELEGHTDQLYGAQFSQCGRFLATVCKDGKIRIYEPRKSTMPVLEGGEIVAKKGARVLWVMDGNYLIVTGFSRQSERQVMVYRTKDLALLHAEVLDVSPGELILLMQFYTFTTITIWKHVVFIAVLSSCAYFLPVESVRLELLYHLGSRYFFFGTLIWNPQKEKVFVFFAKSVITYWIFWYLRFDLYFSLLFASK
jgi:hypothetical protein